jgi:hypothetical protein
MSQLEHPRITEVGRLLAENDRLHEALQRRQAETGQLREALYKVRDMLNGGTPSHLNKAWTIVRDALAKEAGQ